MRRDTRGRGRKLSGGFFVLPSVRSPQQFTITKRVTLRTWTWVLGLGGVGALGLGSSALHAIHKPPQRSHAGLLSLPTEILTSTRSTMLYQYEQTILSRSIPYYSTLPQHDLPEGKKYSAKQINQEKDNRSHSSGPRFSLVVQARRASPRAWDGMCPAGPTSPSATTAQEEAEPERKATGQTPRCSSCRNPLSSPTDNITSQKYSTYS